MNQIRFYLPLVALALAVGLSMSLGCAKSTLKMPSFLTSTSKTDLEKERVLGEVNTALKNMGSKTLTIWHDSFEDAQAAAAATGKPILADFTGSDWCHYCVKLKKDVFEKAEFKEWARDNVILLELDYPKRSSQPPAIKKQNQELAKKYNISGYPTVLLLTPEGQVLGKLGYNESAAKWVSSANAILKK